MQHHATRVARSTVAVRIGDHDTPDSLDVGEMDLGPANCAHLARNAEVREQVGTIGQHVEHDPRIADRYRTQERCSRRNVHVELQDAVVIFAESELTRRAEHPVGRLPADLSLFDLEPAGEHAPGGREWVQLSRGDIRRAAYDVEQLAGAHVHCRDVQVIGVGMRRRGDDARHHDRREVGAQCDELLDRRRVGRQQVTQFCRAARHIGECVQPVDGDVHSATCSRKRTSES